MYLHSRRMGAGPDLQCRPDPADATQNKTIVGGHAIGGYAIS
jgi:hypothetical protein